MKMDIELRHSTPPHQPNEVITHVRPLAPSKAIGMSIPGSLVHAE
jgi:hypothetical protein